MKKLTLFFLFFLIFMFSISYVYSYDSNFNNSKDFSFSSKLDVVFNNFKEIITTFNKEDLKSHNFSTNNLIINKKLNNSSFETNKNNSGNVLLNRAVINKTESNNGLIDKSIVDPKLNNLINTSSNNTNINKSFVNNSSNIHHNTTNLVNLSTDKDKHNVVLFNDTLHNQNQYNKTFKLLDLNHSVNNDLIFNDKDLNISKLNSNMCDDSSEDNFLINPVPESDNKDYNILLLILPALLVLLGAIILYKKKMR